MPRSCLAAAGIAAALVAAGCGRRDDPAPRPGPPPTGAAPRAAAAAAAPAPGCEPAPFAATVPVAEASGAAVLDLGGRRAVLVVGDSGTDGAYVIVDAEDGAPLESGRLPLGDGAGDDLEGVSLHDGRLWAITSAGWLRTWDRIDGGFALRDGPYPIAEVDATLPRFPRRGGLGAPPTDSLACDGHGVNCGKNYEALCLDPGAPPGACAGWAGAKADGRLWCLVHDGDRLRADPTRAIAVTRRDVLSGCDVDPSGAIWIATNALDGAVYRVLGARDPDPAAARIEEVELEGGVFPEAIAVADGALWRFDDLGRAPSLAARWRCAGFAPGAGR